jgi:hypothetical protein
MKKLNLVTLSRNEMRNIIAGNGECGSELDCRYQSPAFTCNSGRAPNCVELICTRKLTGESVSTNWRFSCGQG